MRRLIQHGEYVVAGPAGDLTPSSVTDEADMIYNVQSGFDRYWHYALVLFAPDLMIELRYLLPLKPTY